MTSWAGVDAGTAHALADEAEAAWARAWGMIADVMPDEGRCEARERLASALDVMRRRGK